MIQRINTLNCGNKNWKSYNFVGGNHEMLNGLTPTFKHGCGWSTVGTYDDNASWCCLFSADTPWSNCWDASI